MSESAYLKGACGSEYSPSLNSKKVLFLVYECKKPSLETLLSCFINILFFIFIQLLKGDIKDKENVDYAEEKVKKFNHIMKELNLPYKFIYKIYIIIFPCIRITRLSSTSIKNSLLTF